MPGQWGTTDMRDGDYAMDPDILIGAEDAAMTGLGSLPTLSIVMNSADLFGPDGLLRYL